MARGGLFGRIGRAIRNVVAPPKPSKPPPYQAPERPPPPEPPGRSEFKQTWRDDGGRGSFRKNLKFFNKTIEPFHLEADEQLEVWDSYVRNINRGEGRFRRNSPQNMFWRDLGMDPDDFNWAGWREAMGYTGKQRSRTS